MRQSLVSVDTETTGTSHGGAVALDGPNMCSLGSVPVQNLDLYRRPHALHRDGMGDLSGTVEILDAGRDRGAIASDLPGLSCHGYKMFVFDVLHPGF